MSRYLFSVSYLSFFDNELRQAFIVQDTPDDFQALISGIANIHGLSKDDEMLKEFEKCTSVEEAKELAFNGDSAVNVSRYTKSRAFDMTQKKAK